MPSPSLLPDWVPWWIQIAIVPIAILPGFALLMMPFAVFGLKGRLRAVEAQLDDLGVEIRMLAARLAEPEPRIRRPPPRPAEEDEVQPAVRAPAEPRPRAPAPLPPRPVEPGLGRYERYQEPQPLMTPDPRPRGRDDWPEEGEREPLRPSRPVSDRPAFDRERDPDRLRYAGRSGGGGRNPGEREEPVLRWPPR